jgi:isoleucyl-tRNA synthetase
MESFDQYMLGQSWEVAKQALQWYEEFAFHKIYQRVNQFCVVDLSAVYFDVLKDRLYTFAPKSRARCSAQSAIWLIGEVLVRLLAPIMSFTADEVWRHLPQVDGRPESVHLAEFPSAKEIAMTMSATQQEDWTMLLSLRPEVLKALEEARQNKLIGSGLQAQVKLIAAEPAYSVLERNANQLRALFIVSDVALAKSAAGQDAAVRVEVSTAAGEKCERCWNYSTHVGEDKRYPTVCERCSAVLREIESGRSGPEGGAVAAR